MPDGYSRWREDFAAKDPAMIETGVFYRRCPCCKASLEIKVSPEKDDISIYAPSSVETSDISSQAGKGPRIEPQSAAEAIPDPVDRKCSYCFRMAIRGGVLCREHSFCVGCDKVEFADGKPYEMTDYPRCRECAK